MTINDHTSPSQIEYEVQSLPGFEKLKSVLRESERPREEAKTDLLITGDNLISLEMLKNHAEAFVDFIYIDPPYNTGNKFIFEDRRSKNVDGIFGSHIDWMNFMRPRLEVARSLLTSQGIIAVSIDDYEQPYLRVLMDTIFGENNFMGNIVVCRSKNGRGSKRTIATAHEYLLVYSKTKVAEVLGWPDSSSAYNKQDQLGPYRIDGLFRKKGQASTREERPNLYFPLYYDVRGEVFMEEGPNRLEVWPKDSNGIERRWLWGPDTTRKNLHLLEAGPSGTVYVKNYFSEKKRTKVRSLWTNKTSYYTERATNEIKEIYGEKVFDTPKPLGLIEDILLAFTRPSDTILDFFAGTGTTAHAAARLNTSDRGQRRVILMESDEEIQQTHPAYKRGFKKISEVTTHRLEHIARADTSYKYSVISNADDLWCKNITDV